jgi:N-acetyl-gamma-glutamyl-phosphate reductase
MTSWPVIVVGGTGYVAGELLRLVAAHPQLELDAAVSSSRVGEPLAASFPHLATAYPDQRFVTLDAAAERLGHAEQWAVLSAAPHGASAAIVARLLDAADAAGVTATVVDASADFRFRDATAFASVYGQEHTAPDRLAAFDCAVPEHVAEIRAPHAAHPGCFATSMLLAVVPLVGLGLCGKRFHVSAVTGSTGAGRKPRETTHHPFRHANLFAYKPLAHRHAPEVAALTLSATGREIELEFVPHSGPFARGIHATVFGQLAAPATADEINAALAEFYRASPFVGVDAEPPRMKDIVASNNARLNAAVHGDTVVVCSVLDNLLKGAAGGAVQWLNRLLGLPEHLGLDAPAAGWL